MGVSKAKPAKKAMTLEFATLSKDESFGALEMIKECINGSRYEIKEKLLKDKVVYRLIDRHEINRMAAKNKEIASYVKNYEKMAISCKRASELLKEQRASLEKYKAGYQQVNDDFTNLVESKRKVFSELELVRETNAIQLNKIEQLSGKLSSVAVRQNKVIMMIEEAERSFLGGLLFSKQLDKLKKALFNG